MRDDRRWRDGPKYPDDLGRKVEVLRCGDDRRAHGLAVLEAFRKLHRRELRKGSGNVAFRRGEYELRREYEAVMAEKNGRLAA